MSIELVMPSNHLLLCHSLLLLQSFPASRVFSNESAFCIRWPKYWCFSFSISLSMNIQGRFSLGWTGLISLPSKGLSRVFSSFTVQKHHFFSAESDRTSVIHQPSGSQPVPLRDTDDVALVQDCTQQWEGRAGCSGNKNPWLNCAGCMSRQLMPLLPVQDEEAFSRQWPRSCCQVLH